MVGGTFATVMNTALVLPVPLMQYSTPFDFSLCSVPFALMNTHFLYRYLSFKGCVFGKCKIANYITALLIFQALSSDRAKERAGEMRLVLNYYAPSAFYQDANI